MTIQKLLTFLALSALLAFHSSAAVYYVNVSNAAPAAPYTSWSTAATNIQDAVDASANGDMIVVTDGVYNVGARLTADGTTNRLVVTNAITIQSVDGPAATLVDGGQAGRCMYLGAGVSLSGFTVTNGTAVNGGGIYCGSSNTVVTNCVLANNTANYGGGIYSGSLTNCTLSGNACGIAGGGAYGSILNGCTLTSNGGGSQSGGAGAFSCVLTNCTLTGNTNIFASGGGARSSTLVNCSLNGNSAVGAGRNGGAADSSTLINCTLSNNHADAYGGGANGCLLTNCTVSGNNTDSEGGGVSSSTAQNCTLSSNNSGYGGGASFNCLLIDCYINGNYASYGGGVYGSCTLYNCLLVNNTAGGYGGGSDGCTLNNCTVSGNTAQPTFGGYGGGAYTGTLNNCIVYYNNGGSGAADVSGCTLNYSCASTATGAGNISAPPNFIGTGTYYLAAGSPCIDAGNNAYVTTVVDLAGDLRIVNGTVDMGCYEYHTANPLIVSVQANYTNAVVGYPVTFTGFYNGGTYNIWNFGDGTYATNVSTLSHIWTTPGNYQVALTLYDANYPGGVTGSVMVYVNSSLSAYVNPNSMNPVPPYSSWATAATNIQDAVDAVNAGYIIVVTNGTYQYGGRVVYGALTNRLVINKPVVVQSVNGPSATFIVGNPVLGDSAVRCVYATNGVTLSGFTLTNGATRAAGDSYTEQSGGAIYCDPTNAVVITNCVLAGNAAQNYGGGAYGGTLLNCIVASNSVASTGGGAYGGTLRGCSISNNVAGVSGGAASCVLSNCTISINTGASQAGAVNSCTLDFCFLLNNSSGGNGGGACSSTLRNCYLIGNTAPGGYGGAGFDSTFTGCFILTNSSYLGGGTYDCNCTNCTLTLNTSASGGGGASGGTLVNCLLSFNSASSGGGASGDTMGNDCFLWNCTVAGNSASSTAGGVVSTAWNSIIIDNIAPDATSNYYIDDEFCSCAPLNYCCTQPLPTYGVSNITADPAFINPAAGDFHLQPGSPCIDVGTNYGATATDLDGNPRIVGATIDFGAYEFQGGSIYISQQPQTQIVYAGQVVSLQVTAVSSLPLSYQWQLNGTNLIGATNSSLLFTNAQVTNSGVYNLVISNSAEVISSPKAVVIVYYTPLVILSQPTNETIIQGSNTTISVSAYSPYPIFFQWQVNGTNLVDNGRVTGSTTPGLSIANTQLSDAGAYQLIITNQYTSVTSSVAKLTVLGKPIFDSEPSSALLTVFESISFSAAVSAAPPFTLQWQKNGTNIVNNSVIAGVNSTNLALSSPGPADSGDYVLVASNAFGVAVSSNANLTVLPIYQWGDHYTHPPQNATNLLAVSAGGDVGYGDFDLVLQANGTVVAWGGDYLGSAEVPPTATNVVAIAAGDFFGLALRSDGSVVAWGDNTYGQTNVPANATNIVAIAAGDNHSLALTSDGTVIGWGENRYGECTPPLSVSNVIAIAAGSNYSLALRQDGTAVGWGYNNYGQATVPPNATNIVAIAGGQDHSVALRQDGTVIGWGFTFAGYDVVPVSATNMTAIAAGNSFSDSLGPGGTVLGWGYGDSSVANAPSFLTNVVEISAKEYQNLVLVQDPTTQVAPSIWRQPVGCTVPTGGTGVLEPIIPGSQPMSYQWYFNGDPLSGQTNNWLALVAITTNQVGNYQVVATNNYGAVTSQVATVSEVVGIIQQPVSEAAFVGNSVSVTATAAGFGPIGYQWYFNGVLLTDSARITGSSTSTLTIADAQVSDAGSYGVVVTNTTSTAISAPALLDIASQPLNQQALIGSNVTMSVTNVGLAAVFYQWESNGVPLSNGGRISGATSASLVISNAQAGDTGSYQVVISPTNSLVPATSSVATVTVMLPAGITTEPPSQAVLIGSTVHFSVGTTGTYLGYQWFQNGLPLTDNGHYSGSATPTLTIVNVQSNDAAGYSLLVSNALSSATSSVISLTPLSSPGPSMRYVNVSNASPVPPYLSWSNAAVSIQDAIDASVNGDSITVTDGVYQAGGRAVYGTLSNRVVINKALAIQSVNGASATVIQGNAAMGNSAVRCVYLTNNTVLAGFTLTGGATRTNGDTLKEQSGGGAWCESTNSQLIGCVIVSNTAWLSGGGECFGALSNCILAGNLASNSISGSSNYGGGSYFGTLNGCVLSNNLARIGGGGAYSNILNNCTLAGNVASNSSAATLGGGADMCVLNNCTVSNNFSGRGSGGGAQYSTLTDCRVISNYCSTTGGGGSSCVFNYCSLLGNQASSVAGGAYSSVLINCLIVGNHATSSAGAAETATLFNCTVAGNSAGNGSSGTLGGLFGGTARNSIVYTNVGINSSSTIMTNCCTFPLPGFGLNGPGNITNPPLFVNNNTDFHLQSNSPCINSGKNAYATNGVDLDGNPRISGGTVDMGAYEYQNPASIISYAWLEEYGLPTDGSADYQDTDGTGMNNWQKWIAGLNPTNSASVFKVLNPATNASGSVTLKWISVSTRSYNLQRSTNLNAQPAFSTIQSNVVGMPAGTNSFTDPSATNGGPYFYRVMVVSP